MPLTSPAPNSGATSAAAAAAIANRSSYESDSVILFAQIKELDALFDDLRKSKLIKKSAILLAESHKYDDDLTIICSRLKKAFNGKVSNSFINQELEPKYKQILKKIDDNDNTPIDIYEEIIYQLEDQAESLYNLAKDIKSKTKDKETKQAIFVGLNNLVHDFHENPLDYMKSLNIQSPSINGGLTKLLNNIKSLSAELATLKEMTDDRVRMDIYLQIHCKILLLQGWTYSGLAKKIHYSKKWISALDKKIAIPKGSSREEVFSEVFGFLNEIRRCPNPNCGLDYTKFMISLKKRSDLGEPLYGPEKFLN